MKKILICGLLAAMSCPVALSQASFTGHFGGSPATDWLGWNNNAIPLLFRTNDGTGNRNRMIIMNGAFGPNDGQIAVGDNLPNTFTPTARLHLHQVGNGDVFTRYSNTNTGSGIAQGATIGILNGGQFQLHNFTAGSPIDFFTQQGLNHTRRMRVFHSPTNQSRVGIGNAVNPLTFLHIGDQLGLVGTGWRNWMDVGTLYVSDGPGAPDNMYVGLRRIANDQHDAIISWSDNSTLTPAVTDRLRFVFTSVPNLGVSSGFDGLELCRMVSDGNNPRIGFGDMFTPGLDPQNTVEIRASASSPYWNLPGGTSGLRFTFLTTASQTTANPGLGVLSVDANGDVIYVPDSPGSGFSLCGTGLNPLLQNSEIPLGGFNFEFAGNGAGSAVNNVAIGTGCIWNAKLDVLQSSGTAGSTGINLLNTDGGSSVGVKSVVTNPGTVNTAGWFDAQIGATFNEYSLFTPPMSGIWSIGHPFGTFLTSTTINPVLLQVNGNIDAPAVQNVSDQNIKTQISSISDPIEKIMGINGVSFYFDTISHPNYNLPNSRQIGFIAQNLDSIIPEVVIQGGDGLLRTDYAKITALLVEGIKAQQSMIDSLFSIINNSSRFAESAHVIDVELSGDAVVLEQNIPNPFAEHTTISYFVPEGSGFAQILFYDASGKMIKAVDIDTHGKGLLNVFAGNLGNGIYTYALVVDGKVMETKRMVKTK